MSDTPANIIISRTDSIGDVVLTLPVATVLRKFFPAMKIAFMGKAYTRPVIEACTSVDVFIDIDDFMSREITIFGEKPAAIIHVLPIAKIAQRAKELKIPMRIGTTNRIYHWFTCNSLVKLSRKRSILHEAQLNIKLLEPLGITKDFSLEEIGNSFALNNILPLPQKLSDLIDNHRYNLILHPKSQGNGREWGLENFIRLIRQLDGDKFKIFVSGVEKERAQLTSIFEAAGDRITDITGLMTLPEFMSFISAADGLVASGTGPIHLAAALGKNAFGIYPPIKPIHPGRWAPLGPKAKAFVVDRSCNDCKGNKMSCHCMEEVNPAWIRDALDKAFNEKTSKKQKG
ncbi:glycosyltransferase family 9 protein [Segetibacter aerophilus]|uniref:Lipopolysaccharide heptosyltransferase II n=1 Tax=Segetibacter aerophilus TaxID=670293 RepID=A0A512BEW1_9BACT|nr:glycosyltransferase family 9 protein [Segetibacter aerophilus]GEO10492.1 lipopolysaccharide heptosyltransferase II [Segetibacter aerophilus]